MYYCYDITLNFLENNCLFYDWDSSDYIEVIHKIPIFKINNRVMNDIINNKIRVHKELLLLIKDKSIKTDLKYVTLFGNKNNVIAIAFNNNGYELYRSFLKPNDELSIMELTNNLKNTDIDYQLTSKITYDSDLRYERKIKKIIITEINTLIKNKDYNKLKYLYIEWFNKKETNINEMLNNIKSVLKKTISNKELSIYELIMNSYKRV